MKNISAWLEKIKNAKALLVVLGGMVLGFVFLMNALTTIQLKFDNSELSTTILELENEIKSLEQDAQKSATDEAIETKASKRLGMVKSGETPVKINEIQPDINIQETGIDPNQKISIYFKDWYEQLEKWKEGR